MSTTNVESWAVDLAEVAAIYPFQGWELPMVLIGVIAWVLWHVWCIRWEKQYQAERLQEYGNKESILKGIDSD